MAQAWLSGLANRVLGNGFREAAAPSDFLLSAVGLGLLFTGVSNQATHCLYFRGTVSAVNLNLIAPLAAPRCPEVNSPDKPVEAPEGPLPGKGIPWFNSQILRALLGQRLDRINQFVLDPEQDPRVGVSRRQRDRLALEESRQTRLPKPDGLVVSVVLLATDTDGGPLKNYVLTISPPQNVRGGIEPVLTDDLGMATALLRPRQFPDLKETDLFFLKVTDPEGHVVAEPLGGMGFRPGKVFLLSIVAGR